MGIFNKDKEISKINKKRGRTKDRSSNRRSGRKSEENKERSSRFNNRDNQSKRNQNTRFSKSEKKMHLINCDKCGDSCEVPFKPIGNKPTYCSNCYRKEETPRTKESNKKELNNYELDLINEKLNKIMKALNIE